MKVLHFCNLYPTKLGAFERLLSNLGRSIKEGGDVSVIGVAGIPIERVAEILKEAGVRWYINERWSDGKGEEHPWEFCLPALRVILHEKPDVVVVSFGNEMPCVVVRVASWLLGLRRCRWVWIQHQQICDPGWFTRRLSRIRLLSFVFDHVTAVYEGGRKSILMRGVVPSKVSAIYNGSGEPQLVHGGGWLREELGISRDSTIIVSVSWLVERKRVDFLIRAFAELIRIRSAGRPPVPASGLPVLVVVGDGPLRSQLEQLAVELKVNGRVIFLGSRNDVADILHDADVFALASVAEACALAILEAMACSLPVVATDVGASKEQIINDISGYVVEPEDFDGFVDRLGKLEGNAELRRAMGAEARSRWVKGFSSMESARRHYSLWLSLVGRKPQADS